MQNTFLAEEKEYAIESDGVEVKCKEKRLWIYSDTIS